MSRWIQWLAGLTLGGVLLPAATLALRRAVLPQQGIDAMLTALQKRSIPRAAGK